MTCCSGFRRSALCSFHFLIWASRVRFAVTFIPSTVALPVLIHSTSISRRYLTFCYLCPIEMHSLDLVLAIVDLWILFSGILISEAVAQQK
ncbi:hypothetical protein BDN67DRAFT_916 [Paxillus ammoniavirescens]|nr:hypothetical protein BDN67DRAFT_916 [Paxillus ammoniavirescens]